VIAIYIAMIAVLVAQALTPGEESANISQSFGDKLNDAIGEISTPESSKVAVTGVSISSVTVGDEKLDGDSISMSLGTLGEINGKVVPESATNRALEYSTSDDSIVKVYSDGRIFAASAGVATVTVKSVENPDFSHSITITVEKIPLESISLENVDTELCVGENSRLDVVLYPANASDKSLIWHSSNTDVLSVDENGIVSAISEGEVKVTATAESNFEIVASVKITVKPEKEAPAIPLESIKLTAEDSDGYVNGEMKLAAEIYPEGASGKLLWHSSDESVATVSQKGVVRFHKSGTVTITVKCGEEICDSIVISIKEVLSKEMHIKFEGVESSEDSNRIKQGSAGKIIITLDKDATIRDLSFSSSDESIIKISPDGSIEALRGGTAWITASTTDGETTISTSIKIDVDPLTLEDTIDNFYYWVRKSMGHFGAFLVLGIFAALSYYIVFPKHIYGKITAFEVTIIAGFVVASVTEILQLPIFTYGRYGSFDDVLLDFIGYCTSTIPIYVIIILFHYIGVLVKRIKNHKKQTKLNKIDI
jgi:uncharacterized protein YjdB